MRKQKCRFPFFVEPTHLRMQQLFSNVGSYSYKLDKDYITSLGVFTFLFNYLSLLGAAETTHPSASSSCSLYSCPFINSRSPANNCSAVFSDVRSYGLFPVFEILTLFFLLLQKYAGTVYSFVFSILACCVSVGSKCRSPRNIMENLCTRIASAVCLHTGYRCPDAPNDSALSVAQGHWKNKVNAKTSGHAVTYIRAIFIE